MVKIGKLYRLKDVSALYDLNFTIPEVQKLNALGIIVAVESLIKKNDYDAVLFYPIDKPEERGSISLRLFADVYQQL
jgi:hypothetical protein